MRRATTIALALATGLAAFATEAADDVDDKLGTVERALEAGRDKERALEAETETIEQQIIALRAELVTAARAVQNNEEALTALETRLAELTREESAAAATLGRRRGGGWGGMAAGAVAPPHDDRVGARHGARRARYGSG